MGVEGKPWRTRIVNFEVEVDGGRDCFDPEVEGGM